MAHETIDLAIENLLENACEHTASETPTVSVAAALEDELVRLDISDDGPGIPSEEIEVIESNNETELWHGSGLGLWIVKLVVDRSDGRIEFDTASDGTRVSLYLSRADETATSA